jgi:hypothetical protein
MAACHKTLESFRPDMTFFKPFIPGKALEYLDPKHVPWPGHGMDCERGGMQTIEIESLQDDEYDSFMKSPADFPLRTHLPRRYILGGHLCIEGNVEILSRQTWLSTAARSDLRAFP